MYYSVHYPEIIVGRVRMYLLFFLFRMVHEKYEVFEVFTLQSTPQWLTQVKMWQALRLFPSSYRFIGGSDSLLHENL